MALMYVIQARESTIDGERKTKYYPIAKRWEAASRKELLEEMTRNKSLTESEASSALDYLLEAIPLILRTGRSVRLGELGHFRLSFRGRGSDSPEEITAKNIEDVRIRFVPGKLLKEKLNGLEIERFPEKGESIYESKKQQALNSAKADGQNEEKLRIVRLGLKQGIDIATLAQLTGLSKEKISELKAES